MLYEINEDNILDFLRSDKPLIEKCAILRFSSVLISLSYCNINYLWWFYVTIILKITKYCVMLNEVEIDKRIESVIEFLLSGKRTAEIATIASSLWQVSRRQTDNYISKAKKKISESKSADDLKYEINIASQRYEMLFALCLENADLKTAVSIVEKKCKLLGIAEPKENDGDDNTIIIHHKFVSKNSKDEIDFIDDGDEIDLSI